MEEEEEEEVGGGGEEDEEEPFDWIGRALCVRSALPLGVARRVACRAEKRRPPAAPGRVGGRRSPRPFVTSDRFRCGTTRKRQYNLL